MCTEGVLADLDRDEVRCAGQNLGPAPGTGARVPGARCVFGLSKTVFRSILINVFAFVMTCKQRCLRTCLFGLIGTMDLIELIGLVELVDLNDLIDLID